MVSNQVNHLVESWYSTNNRNFLNELFKTLQKEYRAYFSNRILDKDEAKDVLQSFHLYLFERLSNPKKPVIENFFAFYLATQDYFIKDYFSKKQKRKNTHQTIENGVDVEKKISLESEKNDNQTTLNQQIIKISKEFVETQLKKLRDKILWQEYAGNGLRGAELAKEVNLQLAENEQSISTIYPNPKIIGQIYNFCPT